MFTRTSNEQWTCGGMDNLKDKFQPMDFGPIQSFIFLYTQ